MVAAGKLAQCCTLFSTIAGLGPLRHRQLRWSTHVLASSHRTNSAFSRARTDQVALYIGKPAKYGNHQSTRAGTSIGPWLCQRPELRSSVDNTFDDREQVEGAAGKPINPGDRDDIPGDEFLEQLLEFASVGPRTAGLLPVDFIAPACAKLLKLRVERLAIGADAGVSEKTILCVSFDHILRKL
jgi:hypothetical protein